MFYDFKKHIVSNKITVKEALVHLNELSLDAILFIVSDKNLLIGSLTDGDIRRGLINNLSLDNLLDDFINHQPKYLSNKDFSIENIKFYKENSYKVIPIVDSENKILNIINFRYYKSYLPLDVIIMAGGKGERLKPLTNTIPKPLLKVGDKPIIEHNLDNLIKYGIHNFHISVNYLGYQIETYLGDGSNKNAQISYIQEEKPLGTMGAVSKIKDFTNEFILLTNSDLLTTLDYEDLFCEFINLDADLIILSIPYDVEIPYAIFQLNGRNISSFEEKPTYTYYANGGVYLFKKELINYLPENECFNATDFIEILIKENKKVVSYPFSGYWLDIGKMNDYLKAQEDIKQLQF